MRKALLTILATVPLFLGSCVATETIKINGELEQTIEVFSPYTDPGVTFPQDKYQLIVSGKVNNEILGKYRIVYSIYSKDGELVKELNRFVNVVDTKSPTFEQKQGQEYYVGIVYKASDFITYSDNYDAQSNILVSPAEFAFTRSGTKDVSFQLTDKSGNATNATFAITPKFDFEELAKDVSSKDRSVSYTTSQAGEAGTMIDIRFGHDFSTTKSLSYYVNSGSLHYLEQYPSGLGTYASIQVSAEFGNFASANLSFHVSDSGAFSVGFATIDATKTSGFVSSFSSTINNIDLQESAMLEECNRNLGSVLTNFHTYMENTMHLDIY